MRRIHNLPATTGPVSWTVYEGDAFNVPRIDLTFSSAPVSPGTVTITKDSVDGEDYDTVIRTESAVGLKNMSLEGLQGFVFGDKIVVTYDNPDSVSVTVTLTIDLRC